MEDPARDELVRDADRRLPCRLARRSNLEWFSRSSFRVLGLLVEIDQRSMDCAAGNDGRLARGQSFSSGPDLALPMSQLTAYRPDLMQSKRRRLPPTMNTARQTEALFPPAWQLTR